MPVPVDILGTVGLPLLCTIGIYQQLRHKCIVMIIQCRVILTLLESSLRLVIETFYIIEILFTVMIILSYKPHLKYFKLHNRLLIPFPFINTTRRTCTLSYISISHHCTVSAQHCLRLYIYTTNSSHVVPVTSIHSIACDKSPE